MTHFTVEKTGIVVERAGIQSSELIVEPMLSATTLTAHGQAPRSQGQRVKDIGHLGPESPGHGKVGHNRGKITKEDTPGSYLTA